MLNCPGSVSAALVEGPAEGAVEGPVGELVSRVLHAIA